VNPDDLIELAIEILGSATEGLVSFYSTDRRRVLVVIAIGEHERRLTELLDDGDRWTL
jgi:hypothetical protein